MTDQCIKKYLRLLLVGIFSASTIAMSPIARAQGWYGGVGFGQSKVDIECDLDITCSSDDTDSGWKLLVGNQFNPNAAVEFGYLDMGETKMNGTDSLLGAASVNWEVSGFSVALVGLMPVGNAVNLLGKVGFFRWDMDVSARSSIWGSGSLSESGTDFMFGVGASFNLGKTSAVRIEWERFADVGDSNTTGKSDIDLLSTSLVFQFQ